MIVLVHLLFLFAVLFLLTVRTRTILAYFQQEEYDSSRFWRSLIQVRLFDVIATTGFVCLFFVGKVFQIPFVTMFLSAILFFAVALKERQYKFKKALVMTERAKRLYVGALAVLFISLLAFNWIWFLFLPVVIQVVPLALVLVNALLVPCQNRINAGFVKEAEQRLTEVDLVRIGITGSFGKTTVKHILAQMLEVDAPVFYSRGSINTKLGLTRHIRQRLQTAHKYFIAEMGAYGVGSVQRLCEFADPQFGIVTAVGDAHTERFGSVDVIAQAKSELAEWVCKRGGVIVTTEAVMQFAPFKKLKDQYPANFKICGESAEADTRIVSAVMQGDEWLIKLAFKGATVKEIEFTLPVLGEHNIANVALIATLIHAIKPELVDRIPSVSPHIEQIPHRLQKKEFQNGPLILDDAYNSNELGFKSAIGVLKDLAGQREGRAVLVTPGIAELGPEHDRAHAEIGLLAGEKCDVIYVVNPDRIPTFIENVKKGAAQIIEMSSLLDAQRHIAAQGFGAKDVILYENDLPDLLEEKRFL